MDRGCFSSVHSHLFSSLIVPRTLNLVVSRFKKPVPYLQPGVGAYIHGILPILLFIWHIWGNAKRIINSFVPPPRLPTLCIIRNQNSQVTGSSSSKLPGNPCSSTSLSLRYFVVHDIVPTMLPWKWDILVELRLGNILHTHACIHPHNWSATVCVVEWRPGVTAQLTWSFNNLFIMFSPSWIDVGSRNIPQIKCIWVLSLALGRQHTNDTLIHARMHLLASAIRPQCATVLSLAVKDAFILTYTLVLASTYPFASAIAPWFSTELSRTVELAYIWLFTPALSWSLAFVYSLLCLPAWRLSGTVTVHVSSSRVCLCFIDSWFVPVTRNPENS